MARKSCKFGTRQDGKCRRRPLPGTLRGSSRRRGSVIYLDPVAREYANALRSLADSAEDFSNHEYYEAGQSERLRKLERDIENAYKLTRGRR